MFQAVALLAQTPDLVFAAIELSITRVMAVKSASVDFDRARSAAAARALDRLTRRLVDRKEIVAAELDRG